MLQSKAAVAAESAAVERRATPGIARQFEGLPTELPEPAELSGPIAYDDETSGLYVDDGARVAVVAIAWLTGDSPEGQHCWESGRTGGTGGATHPIGVTRGPDCNYCRGTLWEAAFPFAQGRYGKPEDDGRLSLFEPEEINLPESEWKALHDWVRRVGRIVYHNRKFDEQQTAAGTIPRPGLPLGADGRDGYPGEDLTGLGIWDTQIACKELWPTENTSLKPTMERLFGDGEADEQRALKKYLGPKTDPRYDLVPWDVIRPYAAKDASMTLRLAYYQWDLIDQGEGHRPWVEREFKVTTVLANMERRGLPYHAGRSLEIAQEVAKRAKQLAADLPFATTETAAKQYYFGQGKTARGADCLDLLPYAMTNPTKAHPGGQPSLTAEIVDRMILDKRPHAETWQKWNKLDNARGMWYQPYAERTGPDARLRTCFRQVQVRSGRFSVERVNLQALPHTYRLGVGEFAPLAGLMTPREIIAYAAQELCPGWDLWEYDLKQAELRVAALYAKCDLMLDAFKNGDDLHALTATELFQVDKSHPEWARYRQIGKRANFTLCFGAGPRTFQAMIRKEAGVTLDDREAEKLVRDWNGLYPEFGRAIERHMVRAERLHYVPLANGRQRWFAKWEDRHKALNQRVQASLAEYSKDWMIETDRRCIDRGLDERGLAEGVGRGGLILTVHDSQVILTPEVMTTEIGAEVVESSERLWGEFFPGVGGGAEGKPWGA